MKIFPVNVIVVGNKMVLCQGQIDKKFKELLKEFNRSEVLVINDFIDSDGDIFEENYDMYSFGEPEFTYAGLRINGTRRSKNYKYVTEEYNETNYNGYKLLLEKVKEFMNDNGENYVW